MVVAFLSLLVALAFGQAHNAGAPTLPFTDPGACPFECCQYGEWTATSSQRAYKSTNRESGLAFTVRPGEKITALTGVVITRKAGLVIIRKQTSFEDITVPAGAKLFLLHRVGEGVDLFWYKGATHSAELYVDQVRKANAQYPWDVISLPQTEWWVKVKNSRGASGWLLEPQGFRGMDACGG
ncbi:MAG TPA: hypothetical protein VFQ24_05825 [Terriglobia bacterium]|nr:hypothetical protein [Terriglobia bacterium]